MKIYLGCILYKQDPNLPDQPDNQAVEFCQAFLLSDDADKWAELCNSGTRPFEDTPNESYGEMSIGTSRFLQAFVLKRTSMTLDPEDN